MPMKSKRHWCMLFAKEVRGELKKGTAEEFAHNTKTPFSELPTYSHSAAARRRRREKRRNR